MNNVIEGFRLSPQQAYLWALQQESPAYTARSAISLDGPLDVHSLNEAIQMVIARHEILRTSFRSFETLKQPLQVIESQCSFALEESDLTSLDTGAQTALIDEEFDHSATSRPEETSPLRARLFKLSDKRHLLLLSLPAICSDALTLANLLHEIRNAYASCSNGHRLNGTEPTQYIQISEWLNELLEEEEPAETLWQDLDLSQLASVTLPCQLEGENKTFAPASLEFPASPELVQALESLAAGYECTPSAAWLACWQLLLWRLSAQPTIAIGLTCDGRRYDEMRGALGLFAKSVPLVSRCERDLHFSELLVTTREEMARANAAQEYFVWPAQDHSNGNHARQPFFDVAYEYLEEVSPPPAGDLIFSLHRQSAWTERFKLKLVCRRGPEGSLRLNFNYDSTVLPADAVARLHRYFATLAANAVLNPESRIGELNLLDEAERQQLLVTFNQTETGYPHDQCLHDLLSQQAKQTPGNIAVASASESVTFAELDQRANQLAHHLLALGAGPESRIGVCLDRSVEMIVSLLGVLKAGAAYVALNPTDPPERLAFMLSDAAVSVLLSRSSIAKDWSNVSARVIDLDAESTEINRQPSGTPQSVATPANLAYVLYTSGSSGTPKGTLITHRGLVNYLHWATREYRVADGTGAPLHSPIVFDLTVTSLFAPLLAGRKIVLVPEGSGVDGLADLLLAHEDLSFVKLTPAHLDILNEELSTAEIAGRTHALIIGGENLASETVASWRERAPQTRLINEYGPTETVVGCCVYEVAPEDPSHGSVPIGRPIANTQLYILDERLEPLPIGVTGELYIGGDGLARGYLNRADLTAEKFIPDPFTVNKGARLYRTGDVARYRADGVIEFLGRKDDQVKIHGYRIELSEIETVLRQHPAVQEAVVLALDDERGEKRLVGYVLMDNNAAFSVSDLRRHLLEKLPEYMAPWDFVRLETLPLTRSGKVDRRALPAPDRAGSQSATPFVAPRTLVEEVLAAIWAEVLHVDRVGIDHNFFSLGGDSIRSIQVRTRAQQRGIRISHQQLFQHQTIRELAREVKFGDADEVGPARTEPFSLISEADRARLPEGVEDAYPLSLLQAGMLFHSELNPETAIFHDLHSFHLQIQYDREKLETALQRLAQDHPALRTSFDLRSYSEPLQLVHTNAIIPLEEEDLRHLSEDEQQTIVAASLEEEKQRKFDWEKAPLLRFKVQLRANNSCQFLMSFHHSILDGWSAASLLTELFNSFAALMQTGEIPESAPMAANYRDFVAMERAALNSEEHQKYWSGLLQDARFTRLPRAGFAGPAEENPRGNVYQVSFSDEISQAVRRIAQSASVPVKSVLLAAHLRVMSLLAGDDDVLTALIANGRPEEADGDRLFGLFLNTLPFRLKLADESWNDLVRKTFEAEREQLPFRRYPLAELQRRQGGQPLFETAFNYIHFHVYQNVAQVSDVTVIDYVDFEETNFPLMSNFVTEPVTSLLQLYLNYQPAEFSYAQIKTIGEYYERCLKALVEDPGQQHQRVSLLSETEQALLVDEWNRTDADYPNHLTLAQLFEEQVERTPHAVAVNEKGRQLTYTELNERANRLARLLRDRGIEDESIVPLLMERQIDLLASILAVFKAGAAYLPLDPLHPPQRLRQVITSSGAGSIVSTREFIPKLEEALAEVAADDRPRLLTVEELLEQEAPAENLPRVSDPVNLAYVIYTSGSTGVPKGVMVHQQGMINHLFAKVRDLKLTAADVIAQTASQCFDISVWQFLAALMVGGRVSICDEETTHDPAQLLARVDRERITILEVVPSLLRALLDEAERSDPDLSTLRYLMTTGEALPPDLARQWLQLKPEVPLVNAYGPTECSDDVTHHFIEATADTTRIPIGRPISNTKLYVLDRRLRLAPIGVAAELYVGGDGVGRGYWRDVEQTAQSFIPDPFGAREGARLYKTGDLVQFQPDGTLEFLGRVDQQVKVRGFRIELGEIETVLNTHPAIREAVVTATDSGSRLVAYVVHEDRNQAAVDLREFLKDQLPDYMIPSVFVALDAMPLTSTGKVDRKALPDPGIVTEANQRSYIAPQSPVEIEVAQIWSEVLRVERVGSTDNFFDLGGHSLLATQVISRLRAVFGVELPLRNVFEAPTVALLAARIEESRQAVDKGVRLQTIPRRGEAIRKRETKSIDELLLDLAQLSRGEAELLLEHETQVTAKPETHPLSFSQEKAWQDFQANNSATMSQALRLTGRISIPVFEQCFREIIKRHEALRSTFTVDEGRPVQIISPTATLDAIPVTDLSLLSPAAREKEAQRITAKEFRTLFDLTNAPQLRISLLKLADTEHVLLATMPEIISDAWSIGVLIREMSALYPALAAGQPSPLPELPIQLADFAHWERGWLQGEVLEAQLNYWGKQLGGELPVLDLPTDHPRPSQLSMRGASETLVLRAELMEEIRALARQEEVTLFMFMLAAFKALLHCYTRQDDIVVGIPAAGRNWVETEPLIGSFANTLVIRTDVSGQPSFRELLRRERQVMLDAYAHQEMPFAKLLEFLQAGGGMKEALPYRVMFDLVVAENNAGEGEAPGDLQVTTMEEDVVAGTLLVGNYLTFVLQEVGPELLTMMRYKVELFESETIVKMLARFEDMLREVVAYPDRELSRLHLFGYARHKEAKA
ncbi:MAG TPA: amino acid adenylation domain-containing protein [Pyrinomonadaceae bacterium]|nr:amino acid adenylation domain-containing protein [Pyrinomonadaceae bacterium]